MNDSAARTAIESSDATIEQAITERIFAYESYLERNLQCIPMIVRYKLDKCGVKLSLEGWNRLPVGARCYLVMAPCDDVAEIGGYRAALCELIRSRLGIEPKFIPIEDNPAWQSREVPARITAKAHACGVAPPTDTQWQALAPLQRFALVKLTRDGHDNRNFVPALQEFGLN